MFKYFETTALILFWSFCLSLVWAWIMFVWVARRPDRPARGAGDRLRSPPPAGTSSLKGWAMISPALLVAPTLLITAHECIGLNLLFPIHLTTPFYQVLTAAIAPAGVLLLSCGIFGSIAREIPASFAEWKRKTFALMTLSYGGSTRKSLQKIVMVGVLCRTWSQSLPWLFGELIVVECVFNAPGLGLEAWHSARVRNWWGVSESLAWLALLYACAVITSALFSRWLGKRLESYC